MTGHPALLAPPPPLANPEDQPISPQEANHVPISEGNQPANLQAGLTDVTGPTDFHGAPQDQATALQVADGGQKAEADGSDAIRKQQKDFLGQVYDFAFGPDAETNTGPDFKKYGEILVASNVLPHFAISENTSLPLNLAPNTGRDNAQYMLTKLHDGYFALKA